MLVLEDLMTKSIIYQKTLSKTIMLIKTKAINQPIDSDVKRNKKL